MPVAWLGLYSHQDSFYKEVYLNVVLIATSPNSLKFSLGFNIELGESSKAAGLTANIYPNFFGSVSHCLVSFLHQHCKLNPGH